MNTIPNEERDIPQSPAPPPAGMTRHTMFITLVVACAFFMEMFDSTVIVTALPAMAREFDSNVVTLSLGLTAYMLSTTVLLPSSGWIADRHGTRTVFCCATAVFILSSVWCGLSSSVNEFVIARTLQGAGAALMSPVGRLVVLRGTPREQLVQTMNLLSVPALIGPVLGPPIGGLITTYASWHWCFFINVPIGCGILYLMLKHAPDVRSSERGPFDVTGFVLNGLSLASLIYGLNQLSENWPGDALSYGLISFSAMTGWLSWRHARSETHPLVNIRALQARTFRVCMLSGGGIFRLSIAAPIFLMPLMFQVGMGMTAFVSGMLILMHTSGDLLAKIFVSRIMNDLGFRRVLIGTAAGFAIFLGICATFSASTSYWWICLILFIGGAIRSIQMSASSSLQFAEIPQEEMSHASTLSNILMQVQRAVGVTLGAILLNIAVSLRSDVAEQMLMQIDFRIAFAVMGLISLSAVLSYWSLHKDVGAQLLNRR